MRDQFSENLEVSFAGVKLTQIRQTPAVRTSHHLSNNILVIVRFSILSDLKQNWVLGRGRDLDEVSEILFSNERLKQRFHLFETLTLPSLIAQNHQAFTLVVVTSTMLPDTWKQRLHWLRDKYLQTVQSAHPDSPTSDFIIEEIGIGNYKDQIKDVSLRSIDLQASMVATSRLDDDDALHPTFLQKVHGLMVPENDNKVVSFNRGCFLTLEPELRVQAIQMRLISAGIAYITTPAHFQTIYCLGSHTKLHQQHPLIEDDTAWMYAMSADEHCDSGRKLRSSDPTLVPELLSHYPFLAEK